MEEPQAKDIVLRTRRVCVTLFNRICIPLDGGDFVDAGSVICEYQEGEVDKQRHGITGIPTEMTIVALANKKKLSKPLQATFNYNSIIAIVELD